ncbi:MAG: chromosomal replication initiator protein DnaA [Clostridia bacterium]|nr:chromosomal replication initiator protein DnaA [Clostridia bacterium]
MEMEVLWEQACALMKEEMNPISYNTWIEGNLEPVQLDQDVISLEIGMENMRPMINNRYVPIITRSLTSVAGHPVTVRVLTHAEAEALKDGNDTDDENSELKLNPRYTFESFVVGDANKFAHAAALAVAESPADAYNPLFIYGGVGLGKTHLMQAVGNYVREQYPDKKVLYITSADFTNELINAIQQRKTYEFRDRFRKVDVLMVDDIQFIAGRESTQQEFFNTFNELHNAGKQIILTSDKPPKDIARLEERLCSRFEWGLVADIQRPDIDTRVAILREKARQEHIRLDDDVLQLIAGKIDSNIRELEGSLKRLVAYSGLVGEPISVALCEVALKETFDQNRHRQITAELIMQTVSDYYGITISDLTGPTRKREITIPRQIAMFITREMTGMSFPQIGTVFGGRDHTTVMHSYKTVEAGIKTSSSTAMVVDDVRRLVRNTQ